MKLFARYLALFVPFGAFAGCGSETGGPDSGSSTNSGSASFGPTNASSGGNPANSSGGTFGGLPSGNGGSAVSSGGEPNAQPLDCSAALVRDGWELCDTLPESCSVVFTDGTGCSALCAELGLACGEVRENLDGVCAPDESRPALACSPDSGHSSDYCVCVAADPGGGSGGQSATGGSASGGETSTGGASSGGSSGAGGSTGGAGSGGSSGGGNAPCAVPSYIFDDPAPIGWASEGTGTTGGGDAEPVLVTTLADFKAQVAGTTAKVIYVQGTFAPDKISIGSNKTIIGCSSGATLKGAISIGNGSSNLILRNLNISGYGVGDCSLDPDYDASTGCSSGNDALGIKGNAHHVWIDHSWVHDGTDGNLDVTNNADFVTISWTKFSYAARSDNQGDDSTGASGHRYSNLVGGTDSAPSGFPGTIPLNVTWHHNWWAENVVERQPRVRYGRNHIFNNYYSSDTTNYCVRAGIEAQILIQGNHFDGVKSPHQFNSSANQSTAYISLGAGAQSNLYEGVTGDQVSGGGGDQWTSPPYAYTVSAASGVKSSVMSGAGPH